MSLTAWSKKDHARLPSLIRLLSWDSLGMTSLRSSSRVWRTQRLTKEQVTASGCRLFQMWTLITESMLWKTGSWSPSSLAYTPARSVTPRMRDSAPAAGEVVETLLIWWKRRACVGRPAILDILLMALLTRPVSSVTNLVLRAKTMAKLMINSNVSDATKKKDSLREERALSSASISLRSSVFSPV